MESSGEDALSEHIDGAFSFSDLAVRVVEAGTEDEVFVLTIQAVRRDLEETERLLRIPWMQRELSTRLGKSPNISACIQDVRCCLDEIGRWVGQSRGFSFDSGCDSLETKVWRILSDRKKVGSEKVKLLNCHQKLSAVLSYLLATKKTLHLIKPLVDGNRVHSENVVAASQKRKSIVPSLNIPQMTDSSPLPKTLGTCLLDPIKTSPFLELNAIFQELEKFQGPQPFRSDTSFPQRMAKEQDERKRTSTLAVTHLLGTTLQSADKTHTEENDTPVSLHAVNPFGPVNPFELFPTALTSSSAHSQPPQQSSSVMQPHAKSYRKAQAAAQLTHDRPGELGEMLKDLHFPVELLSHEMLSHSAPQAPASLPSAQAPLPVELAQKPISLQTPTSIPEIITEKIALMPEESLSSSSSPSSTSPPVLTLRASALEMDLTRSLPFFTSTSLPFDCSSSRLSLSTIGSATTLASSQDPEARRNVLQLASEAPIPIKMAAMRMHRQRDLLTLLNEID